MKNEIQSALSEHLKNNDYPFNFLPKSTSPSMSPCSSISQASNDTMSLLNQRITLITLPTIPKPLNLPNHTNPELKHTPRRDSRCLKRCNWITENSDKVYVQFHDERWGVPVYEDNQLFELLTISGMLMNYNYTEILKKSEKLREAFGGFDAQKVAKMGAKEIADITANKYPMLEESKVLCIVNNAKCITKVVKEFGSLNSYLWDYLDHKPVINRYKCWKNVPLRSPKSEIISRELVKRGFRLVGPVIIYSFMQASGMTMDHVVDCFRYTECRSHIGEAPWNVIY